MQKEENMNKKYFFVYRFLTIVSLSSGLILNLKNTTSPEILMLYYTMISNTLCLLFFIILPLIKKKYENLCYAIKGAITIAILLTMLVYMVSLLPKGYVMFKSSGIGKEIGNLLVHVISPMLVILDYFFFDEKGKFKTYYRWLWLIIPILYVCFVYLYHSKGGYFYGIGGSREFAYFFLDYQKYGVGMVGGYIIVIAIIVFMFSSLLVLIDKKLAKT